MPTRHAVPVAAEDRQRGSRGPGGTDGLERVIHAVAEHLPDLGRDIGRTVHDVGGAVRPRRLEPGVVEIDGDDRRGPREPCALDDRRSDTAAADDGDGGAGAYLRAAEHGADAGDDAARQQAPDVQSHLVGHLDQRVLPHQGVAGERADVAEPLDDLASRQLESGAGALSDLRDTLALRRVPDLAVAAQPARGCEGADDAVARAQRGHRGADRLDDARHLVPDNHG